MPYGLYRMLSVLRQILNFNFVVVRFLTKWFKSVITYSDCLLFLSIFHAGKRGRQFYLNLLIVAPYTLTICHRSTSLLVWIWYPQLLLLIRCFIPLPVSWHIKDSLYISWRDSNSLATWKNTAEICVESAARQPFLFHRSRGRTAGESSSSSSLYLFKGCQKG